MCEIFVSRQNCFHSHTPNEESAGWIPGAIDAKEIFSRVYSILAMLHPKDLSTTQIEFVSIYVFLFSSVSKSFLSTKHIEFVSIYVFLFYYVPKSFFLDFFFFWLPLEII